MAASQQDFSQMSLFELLQNREKPASTLAQDNPTLAWMRSQCAEIQNQINALKKELKETRDELDRHLPPNVTEEQIRPKVEANKKIEEQINAINMDIKKMTTGGSLVPKDEKTLESKKAEITKLKAQIDMKFDESIPIFIKHIDRLLLEIKKNEEMLKEWVSRTAKLAEDLTLLQNSVTDYDEEINNRRKVLDTIYSQLIKFVNQYQSYLVSRIADKIKDSATYKEATEFKGEGAASKNHPYVAVYGKAKSINDKPLLLLLNKYYAISALASPSLENMTDTTTMTAAQQFLQAIDKFSLLDRSAKSMNGDLFPIVDEFTKSQETLSDIIKAKTKLVRFGFFDANTVTKAMSASDDKNMELDGIQTLEVLKKLYAQAQTYLDPAKYPKSGITTHGAGPSATTTTAAAKVATTTATTATTSTTAPRRRSSSG
ncbi:hypothetical protein AYO45_03415 [Gammaproteobacteria bacterium SCGC AG-212-F23]|nr:hypothetical protein AYO45_03415 [Gammaproteobacteria bacterium SCGC AG-212-F23]